MEQEKAWAEWQDGSLCWPQQGKHRVIRINYSGKTKKHTCLTELTEEQEDTRDNREP